MFEKIKKEFLYLFLQSLFTKISLRNNLFFPFFATFYHIGNIAINILQSCVFALDTQYSLNQVCVVSILDFYQKLPLLLL